MDLKICFIAPSGFGKTTAIKILSKFYKIKNIKIAKPLYDMQKYFYKKIKTKMRGEQDGELLQFFGLKVRKENSNFLTDVFIESVKKYNSSQIIISNDDCRPPDYQTLKNLGFVFVKINGFCRNRKDHTRANPNLNLEWKSEIPHNYSVDNFGTMKEYKSNLLILIKQILGECK